jgi:autotransporter-associated beta strand protein
VEGRRTNCDKRTVFANCDSRKNHPRVDQRELLGINTCSGDTTIAQGTLQLTNPNSYNDAAAVTIAATGATLDLNFDESGGNVTDIVGKLFIGGIEMPPGIYGASGSGADPAHTDNTHFAGNGTLTVGWVANGPPTVTSFTPNGGWTGDSVVITGTHFTGATAVTFNSTAAPSFTVNSDTQITAVVPTGVSTGMIVIAVPGGQTPSTMQFVAVDPAIPRSSPSEHLWRSPRSPSGKRAHS